MYSAKIRVVGVMLPNFIGFIDVTKIKICRPYCHQLLQRAVYSGHKRFSFFSYLHHHHRRRLDVFCARPVEGRKHDLYILQFFALYEALQDVLVVNGVYFYVYGDSTYTNHIRPWLLTGFPRAFSNTFMRLFNRYKQFSKYIS